MRSWEEINAEYEEELEKMRRQSHMVQKEQDVPKSLKTTAVPTAKKHSGRKASAVISNLIFYGAIALLLLATIAVSSGNGGSRSVLGYRYFHVLTSSMNTVYPKGSFVIVSEKAKDDIKIGDDITFYADPNTTVTHRVIDIIDNFDGTGAKGYETQGTENLNPDPDICHEENVVGRVVYCIPKIGSYMELAREHMMFIFIIFIAAVLISMIIRMLLAERRKGQQEWVELP